ncbi:MAG: hypothetical protein IK077_12000 [Thermoguttaceae bacterium]|nr:hypothetical protein [Thermoguttaceae bacterium]
MKKISLPFASLCKTERSENVGKFQNNAKTIDDDNAIGEKQFDANS